MTVVDMSPQPGRPGLRGDGEGTVDARRSSRHPPAMRPGFPFSTRFRVRYSEIDGQKIVFNSRYLEYADVTLGEFWRWADLGDIGPDWLDAEFNVVRAAIDYKKPFVFDDMVEGFARVERVGTSSMTMRVELRHADTGELHTEIEMVSVHVDLATRKSKPIPENVRVRLEGLGG